MMYAANLHDEFVKALFEKVPKRAELVGRVSEILSIEKESVSRRLAGKVHFSVAELGSLARAFNLSVDYMLRKEAEIQWIPFRLDTPFQYQSLDTLCDMLDARFTCLGAVSHEDAESGNVHHGLPIEFYMHYPMLFKFMIFKWGHNFIGSEEFEHFGTWGLPERLTGLKEKIGGFNYFKHIFYIWDNSIVWTFTKDIQNFHRMHVITSPEKEQLKTELKDMLTKLEYFLQGTFMPDIPHIPEFEFYLSITNIGFTCSYLRSKNNYSTVFQTNFSYAVMDDGYDSFSRIKKWLNSLKNAAVLLSGSGRIERRLFFEKQHHIIEHMLGYVVAVPGTLTVGASDRPCF